MSFETAKHWLFLCLSLVPDPLYLRLRYRQRLGFWPNLKSPTRFTEKLQWLKIHDRRPEMPMLADKLRFKQFVNEQLGSQYTIPILSKGRKAHHFSSDLLPSTPFVLKTNHDSGGTKLFSSPPSVDIRSTQQWIKKRLSRNFYYANREWEYRNIAPMWFTEPLIRDATGNARLNDLKVHCFNGTPHFVQAITDREKEAKENWFTSHWEPLDFFYFSPRKASLDKPTCLDEMLDLARHVSQSYPYVRIDFYIIKDRPVLGEMTFRPWGGFMKWSHDETDYYLGNMINTDAVSDMVLTRE